MKIKAVILTMIFVMVCAGARSQNYSMDNSLVFDIQHEKHLYNGKLFPSVKPLLFADVIQADTSLVHFSDFISYYKPWVSAGNDVKFMARIEPLFEGAADIAEKDLFLSHSAIGVSSVLMHKNTLLSGSFRFGAMRPFEYEQFYCDSFNILPGLGMISQEGLAKYYVLPQVRLNHKVSPHFSAETGIGNHFFGDGRRSLILSDEAYPYPYVKFQTDIWKLRYVNLYAWMRDAQTNSAQNWGDGLYKFNAMHYLSWNVSKRLNVSVFEAIVTPLHDSLMQRQFVEYNYLLPVVMYRPLDFALGSPDNVLIGLNVSYKLMKSHVLYGQFVMDEFFMSEVRSDILQFVIPDSTRQHGAWVNKQAFQLGWKYYDLFGLKHFDGLAELNVIRPYIYSHRDIQQNYTHLNQSLAHPQGANLIEVLTRFRYTSEQWFCILEISKLRTGLDSAGTHYGQDIFKPTFDSHIDGLDNVPVSYYGNTIGQGVQTDILYISLRMSKLLFKQYNIWGELGYSIRNIKSDVFSKNYSNIWFSIKWGIGGARKGM